MNQWKWVCHLAGILWVVGCSSPPKIERSATLDSSQGGLWPEKQFLDEQASAPLKIVDGSQAGFYQRANAGRSPATVGQGLALNKRATAHDFIDESISNGSLWAPMGQTNFFFTQNRIRAPGDLVAIKIDDKLLGSIAEEVKMTLQEGEVQSELQLAQKKLEEEAIKKAQTQAKANSGKTETEAPEIIVREAGIADIDVLSKLPLKSGDVLMGEILERYPNGNYRIQTSRQVIYQGVPRQVRLVAIARDKDVEGKETVEAQNFYEYKVRAYR